MLSKKAILEYKKIYECDKGVTISYEEAEILASDFMAFFRSVYTSFVKIHSSADLNSANSARKKNLT